MIKSTAVSRLTYTFGVSDSGKFNRLCSWIVCCRSGNGILPRAGSQIPFARSQSSHFSQVFSDPVPDCHLFRSSTTLVSDFRFLSLFCGAPFSQYMNLPSGNAYRYRNVNSTLSLGESQPDLTFLQPENDLKQKGIIYNQCNPQIV